MSFVERSSRTKERTKERTGRAVPLLRSARARAKEEMLIRNTTQIWNSAHKWIDASMPFYSTVTDEVLAKSSFSSSCPLSLRFLFCPGVRKFRFLSLMKEKPRIELTALSATGDRHEKIGDGRIVSEELPLSMPVEPTAMIKMGRSSMSTHI